MSKSARISRYALLAVAVGLAVVLLVYAVLTYRELAEMQQIYLRDRAATIAARLETMTPQQLAGPLLETLVLEEPALVDLRIFRPDESGDAVLDALWSGRELFHTEEVAPNGERLFRAFIPFHSEGVLHIARIDLAFTATDFLLAHARRNLMVASSSGLTLLLVALWAVWSARRAAQLETRQLQMEHLAHLGQMSAVLAHEIRNPLGTIKGFAQLACEKADQKIIALLSPVLSEILRLEKLVNDLLLYGKPCKPALRTTEWRAMAEELEHYAREAIGDRPIRFQNQGENCAFETDPDLLKEILLNLIRNSVEALVKASSGEVRLAAAAGPRNGLLISVEDDGPGFDKSMIGHLFEPFFTTKASGTGLGLSVARKLTRALGGELSFHPLDPHGTRAEIAFAGLKVHGTNSDH